MKRKPIFNPDGTDEVGSRRIIRGNTTNLFNLNNVKFQWGTKLYRAMMENFWIPEKVDLASDVVGFEMLTPEERFAFKGIFSFLIFLDSIQTNNVPNFNNFITAPEVNIVLAIQTYQEAIHSQSYAYTIESIIPVDERESVYEFWRFDERLLSRIKHITSMYEDFIADQSPLNFFRALIANFLLEGLYFYNGFNFFYNLASRNVMSGVSDIIRYINRDELSHVVLFQNIINEVIATNLIPEDVAKTIIREMFIEATEMEIEWTNYILGDHILGITKATTESYTKWMANHRLGMIRMEPIYPGFDTNPYRHLERIADTEGDGSVKANFFESTVTSYNQSSVVEGWDEL